MVRRLLQRLGMQPVHWCCVVELLHFNRHDPLTRGHDEYNFHCQLALDLVRQEAEMWNNVDCNVVLARSELEGTMHVERCTRSMAWSQARHRLVAPVTQSLHPAHQLALQRGLPFHAYANYSVSEWPAAPQEHETRHLANFLRGGGLYLLPDHPIGRADLLRQLGVAQHTRARRPRLWLFYMDDEPPSAAQLQADKHFTAPFALNPGQPAASRRSRSSCATSCAGRGGAAARRARTTCWC